MRVEGEVQVEHVHRLLAEDPELAALRVRRHEREHLGDGRPRACATRGACSRAFATEMSGSRPEADDVTASTGTDRVAAPAR